MLLSAFFLGNTRLQIAFLASPPVPDLYSIEFEGKITSDPVYNTETERIICDFRLQTLDGSASDAAVRLYLRSDVVPLEGIEYGQTLRCIGHVWPQDPATNPYQFDSRKWLRSIGMTGMAAAKLEDVQIESSAPNNLHWAVIQIRKAISSKIDVLFPENSDLVRAFVLGDRSSLDSELRDAFSKTGVAHLIAISGLHISVLAMAVLRLFRVFFRRRTAVLSTIAIVILYGFLIGFPASLIRATVMFSVFSLAPLLGFPSDSITRLSAAMFGMLIVNPFYLYNSGFILSFAASAGIILLEPPISTLLCVDRLKHLKPSSSRSGRILQKIIAYFPQLLCTTLAAQLATLPAVIAFFGAQSLISIPVNLLAIPLAMLAYPLSLLALLTSLVSQSASAGFAHLPDAMFSALTSLIRAFATVSTGSFAIPQYPGWLLIGHCMCIMAASELSKLASRVRKLLPVMLVAFAAASVGVAWIGTLPFRVIFFDAGQADAAMIRTEGKNYVFDVGDLYTPLSEYAAAACLSVDAVFLSHPHYDHAAGLTSLLQSMRPEIIYVPEGWFDVEASDTVQDGIDLAMEMGIPIAELRPGDELNLSENTSLIVHDTAGTSVNDMSLLLEVCHGETSILFTGDLSTDGEPVILPDVDILKVPHHGSSKATSTFFAESTSPELAVISVGDNNYGHPSDQTIERLINAGADVLRTDECGAITVWAASDGDMYVQTYLSTEENP